MNDDNWFDNKSLLTSLYEGLQALGDVRLGDVEVEVSDPSGPVATCSVDYFLMMYAEELDTDGDAVSWVEVESLNVRTL